MREIVAQLSPVKYIVAASPGPEDIHTGTDRHEDTKKSISDIQEWRAGDRRQGLRGLPAPSEAAPRVPGALGSDRRRRPSTGIPGATATRGSA